MNKKLTWEDIFPCHLSTNRDLFINYLKQAEKEGKVCLNSPSEEEVLGIVAQAYCSGKNSFKEVDTNLCIEIAKAISKRLRGEE